MKNYIKVFVTAALLAVPFVAEADEGMWMIQAIDKALEKNMKARGLKLSAGEIYNADAEGAALADAVVSMDFGCTGSVVSDNGLVITNHHCAYADVHKLSTPEMNYLDKGFWAMTAAEERPIAGKAIWFLKKVVDVTEQTEALKRKLESEGKAYGMRKVSWLMEKEYAEDGLEASFSSMWGGSKYYIAYYKVYRDIRLVAAPPVCIAAFGGDTDNWEWPQHKCDFAMYRIYTAPDGSPAEYSESNVPLHPAKKLKISLKGYKMGDFTMVIGYPGRTDRYSSSAKVRFEQNVALPISNELRGRQMEIMKAAMDRDPEIRLKYADRFFMLSNVQEMQLGTVQCFRRFKVADGKAEQERELAEWIEADPQRRQQWGRLLQALEEKYNAVTEAEKDLTYYRETLIRGCQLSLAATRLYSMCNDAEKQGKQSFVGDNGGFARKALTKLYGSIDMAVERELFGYSVETFFRNVSPEMFSEYQRELLSRFSGIPADKLKGNAKLGNSIADNCLENMAEWLWNNSILCSKERMEKFLAEEHSLAEYREDPIFRFYSEIKVAGFNRRIGAAVGKPDLQTLGKEYTHALYQMRQDKGIPQYPDANSTMRLTYGTVGPLLPRDGVYCSWKSTTGGLLQKHNPDDYDFCLNERCKSLLESSERPMPVDFICDCDITGGNSGSPVLNARGELIGLAFDGNKESLASDASYTEDYNKCVCVDIRFVMWVLDKYAGMDRIVEELGF